MCNGKDSGAGMRGELLQADEHPSIGSLVRKGEHTHAETTVVAKRALKIVEETKIVQEQTLKELKKQGEQFQKVDEELNKLDEQLTYSERLLRYMNRCCICWVCDGCTGADPEGQRQRQLMKQADRGTSQSNGIPLLPVSYPSPDKPVTRLSQQPGSSVTGKSKPAFRDPNIMLPPEHQAAASRMQAHTDQQNKILDDMNAGVRDILDVAHIMGEEVDRQNVVADRMTDKMDKLDMRLQHVNNKTQLGNFKA